MLRKVSKAKNMFKNKVIAKYRVVAHYDNESGWYSPEGKFFPLTKEHTACTEWSLGTGHDALASQLLNKFYPNRKPDGSLPSAVVLTDTYGWIRCARKGVFYAYKPTRKVLDTLIEVVSKFPPNAEVYVEFEIENPFENSFYRGTAKEFLDRIA